MQSVRFSIQAFEDVMGSSQSKKDVESTGTVNNNVVLKTSEIDFYSAEIAVLFLILVVIQALYLLVTVYQMHKRNLRKTYNNRENPA